MPTRNFALLLRQKTDMLAKLRAKVLLVVPKRKISWQRYSGVMPRDAINQAVLEDFEAVDAAMWR